MRRLLSVLLLLPLLFSLSACHGTVGDGTIAAAPTRVAVLFSSLCEVWQAAGGMVSITVGESVERGLVPEGVPLVDAGAGKQIGTERLLAERPDLVIYSPDIPAQAEAAALCERVGIPTLGLRVESFADYVAAVRVAAEYTEDLTALQELSALESEVAALLAGSAVGNERILFVRAGSSASSTKVKATKDHFAAKMLAELGCRNIADDAPILIDTLSAEAILHADPDAIFFSMMGDEAASRANINALLARPEWQVLRAVREGRVYILPRELFHFKPCGRYATAYRYLISCLGREVSE